MRRPIFACASMRCSSNCCRRLDGAVGAARADSGKPGWDPDGGTAAGTEPLETTTLDLEGAALTIPTQAILQIKGVLILKRNATRDYLDFVALATRMGPGSTGEALRSFDRLYPQKSGESALQQLQAQLANPLPYDLDESNLSEYRDLAARWLDWAQVKAACGGIAVAVFDHVCDPPK